LAAGKLGRRILLVVVGLALAMQLVPYGWSHANPPTTREAPWPTARARSLAVAACYDCHSNRTNWRWYSFVAPVSWLVRSHVGEGRSKLNFSEWDQPQHTHDLDETVEEGSMPPTYYKLVHADARLSRAERDELARALHDLPRPDDGSHHHDDD
jgi:hypothetical protein